MTLIEIILAVVLALTVIQVVKLSRRVHKIHRHLIRRGERRLLKEIESFENFLAEQVESLFDNKEKDDKKPTRRKRAGLSQRKKQKNYQKK